LKPALAKEEVVQATAWIDDKTSGLLGVF
jgi:hypothetical protein